MPEKEILIGNRPVGYTHPTYIIAEIGINHNGSVDLAKKMIEAAKNAGCDAVKFQKRTPEICVPKDQWDIVRETPWGHMTYMEYRKKVELGADEYFFIDQYCKEIGIQWMASCWDEPSVDFIEQFHPVCYKAASASLTDISLLKKMASTKKPLIISTGMSTMKEIETAVTELNFEKLLIAHSTSTYPCPLEELNLNMIHTLKKHFPNHFIGYSGHETGLIPSCAAITLGACFLERHITLDRAMWGTDQAASVEPGGFQRLVMYIRDIEKSLGDGIKKVYPSEVKNLKKLRRIQNEQNL